MDEPASSSYSVSTVIYDAHLVCIISSREDWDMYEMVNDIRIITTLCKPCHQRIVVEHSQKCIINFQAHLKWSAHKVNVIAFKSMATSSTTSTTESMPESKYVNVSLDEVMHEVMAKLFKQIGVTLRIKKLQCHHCLTQLLIFPQHGDLFNNINAHLSSKEHKSAIPKQKQPSLDTSESYHFWDIFWYYMLKV